MRKSAKDMSDASSSQASISANWSCSSGSHTAGDIQQIMEMKLQNERLQQAVSQLKSNLETTNEQLHSALAAASASNSLREEITNMKSKIKEINEIGNQKQKELKAQIVELMVKSEEEKCRLTNTNEAQAKELQKAKQCLKDTQKERNLLADELVETKQQLQAMLEKATKLNKQKTKQQGKLVSLSHHCQNLEEKYNALCILHDQFIKDNKIEAAKHDDLNQEMQNMKAYNLKLADSLSSAKTENKDLQNAIEIIQQQTETQKDDLCQLTEQREKLLSLVQKLHSMTCVYEDELEVAKSQNNTLKDKTKKANALGNHLFADQVSLESITFPFDGELKNRIQTTLSFDHFQPMQKLQLVINDIAKEMTRINQKMNENENSMKSNSESCNEIKEKFEKTSDLLNSIMREWKNLECNEENIDVIAFCEKDANYLDFLAEECVKLENLNEAAEFLGPLFVPGDLLSDEGSELRKELISNLASSNKELSIVISAIFLINSRLKKQVNEMIKGSCKKEELTSTLKCYGIEQFDDVPSFIEELQKQVVHLKSTRREVHVALVAARDAISENEKQKSDLLNEVQVLKQKVISLSSENEFLHKEIEKFRNSILNSNQSTTNENTNSAQSSPHSKTSISSNCTGFDYDKTINNLQEIIQAKTKENDALQMQLSKLKEEAKSVQSNKAKQFAKKEHNLLAHIKDLEDTLAETTTKFAQAKKKSRNIINAIRSQSALNIEQANQKIEQAKIDIQAELSEAKDKAAKARTLMVQLQDSLSISEKKNNELADDNSRLNRSLQALEMKVNSIQEQFAKEQKAAQASYTVKMLNIETQHQKETKELKIRLENDKQKAIDFFTQHLGAIYGIIDLDFDEATLTHMFSRLQSDLVKLRFFQDQATKY